ncbi:MAG: NAD-dependent epimerase/dehydratase family protein [Ktedonobacteraceae bacterium]|nr:NAD-dependent epimerase/dehydratase family protein [Ktedonobacteraceae bacterium]
MRILVIGGTRFIGLATVRYLSQQGHDVAVFHRGRTQSDLPTGVQQIIGEWAQIETFKQTFLDFAPDVVLDTIAFVEQDARMIMELCNGLVRRVVLISSQDVYRAYGRVNRTEPGPPDPLPITEDSPLREKRYPYRGLDLPVPESEKQRMHDYDKIPIEQIVMSDPTVQGTILRLPAVYGPNDYQHRLFEFLKRMDDSRPAILLDERMAQWRWTRGYIENVAAAIGLAITSERAAGRIYNVGEAHPLPMIEWVRAIADIAGWHGDIVTLPADRVPPHLVPDIDVNQDLLVDTTRIRKELSYREPVDVDEALRRTIAWERAHPPEQVDAKQFDYAAEDAALA